MTEKKNAGGRPKSYHIEQVRAVVISLMASGTPRDEINAAAVKRLLCADHGVSGGINAKCLEDPVAHVLDSIAEEEERRLIAALPDSAGVMLDNAVAAMKSTMMLALAKENSRLQSKAGEECERLRCDKDNANWRLQALERDYEAQGNKIESLSNERDEAYAAVEELKAEVAILRTELAQKERERLSMGQLLAELQAPGNRDQIRNLLTEILSERPNTEVAS